MNGENTGLFHARLHFSVHTQCAIERCIGTRSIYVDFTLWLLVVLILTAIPAGIVSPTSTTDSQRVKK